MTRRRLALTVLVAVVLLLALAEVGARLFGPPPPPPAWRSHALVGAMRAPGFKAKKIAIDTNEPFTYEVNELGFRSKTLNKVVKDPGVYRIVFIGGSTTENGDLPHEHTFPGIVEARLGGKRVEVANVGLPGATTNVVLAQLVHRVLPLRPDLVVCLDPALNDFLESLRQYWDPTMSHLAADPPTPRFGDWLVGQSRLLAIFATRTAEAPNARELLDRMQQEYRKGVYEEGLPDTRRGLPHFEAVQRVFLEICRDEKIACGMITEPTLLKPGMSPEEKAVIASGHVLTTNFNLRIETELAALEAYDDVTRKNAAAYGAFLIDAARKVPKDLAHFYDDAHLNRKGNEVVADEILAAIAPVISR